ncbi:hypothetical protein A3Q56_00022 [Intoshia linei]|uniref:Uncharacterized protein n=1 Tax=Intoshia linei TaxID=1819745 RepID=A0A177BDG0_9BILA|nr:hypothetical protein A3Q56_00022 [Intoshia linei]
MYFFKNILVFCLSMSCYNMVMANHCDKLPNSQACKVSHHCTWDTNTSSCSQKVCNLYYDRGSCVMSQVCYWMQDICRNQNNHLLIYYSFSVDKFCPIPP